MYEFIQTPTGWRVFWGIHPTLNERETNQDNADSKAPEEPTVLPFQRPDPECESRPAA